MKFKVNKNLLVFNIDNVIDVITNSSSELFIFKSDNGKILFNMLKSFQKDFVQKVGEPVRLKDATDRLFNYYVNNLFPYEVLDNEIDQVLLPEGVKFEDIYTLQEEDGERAWYFNPEDYSNVDEWADDYDWKNPTYHYKVENWREKVQNAFDPGNTIWILYIDDYMITSEVKDKVKNISTYERY
jgi:hypothetical protein